MFIRIFSNYSEVSCLWFTIMSSKSIVLSEMFQFEEGTFLERHFFFSGVFSRFYYFFK